MSRILDRKTFLAVLLTLFVNISLSVSQPESSISADIESASRNDLIRIASQAQLDMSGSLEELRSKIYQYYELDVPKKNERIIVNAEEIFSGKVSDLEETVTEFRGNVEIEIIENGVVHKILAEVVKIYPNMKTIYAGESVQYEYENQKIFARNMIFNSEDFSSLAIAIRGSHKISQPSNENFKKLEKIYFRGEKIHKTSSGFIILDNSIATSCNIEKHPHYHFRFSKLWIYQDKQEIIAKNLSLFLGHVPLFYLPIYYHSNEILFFNPVIGYRNPSGIFYHTTVYIYGKKTRESTDSESQSEHFKVMLDYYSKLGIFGGLHGYVPYTKTEAKFGIAHSYTIFNGSSLYPSSGAVKKQTNTSTWFKKNYPFRFGADVKGEFLNIKYAIQHYSDPYFSSDFFRRHENSFIFGFLIALESDNSQKQIYHPKNYLQYKNKWKFPKLGINSLSIDYLDFELISAIKRNKNIATSDSPNYYFYIPSTLNFPNLQISLNSSWTFWKSSEEQETNENDPNKKSEKGKKDSQNKKNILKPKMLTINQIENLEILDDSLQKRIFKAKALHSWQINNRLSHKSNSSKWKKPQDVELLFDNIYNLASSRISGGFQFSSNDRYFNISNKIELNLQHLERLNIKKNKITKLKREKNQTNRFLILNDIIDFNYYPFLDFKNWKETGIDYKINSRIYQNIYDKKLSLRKKEQIFLPNEHSFNTQIRYDNSFIWGYAETKTELPPEIKFKSKSKSGIGFSYWGFSLENYLYYYKNVSTFDSMGYGIKAKYEPISKIALYQTTELNFKGNLYLAHVGIQIFGLKMEATWKDTYLFAFQRSILNWKPIKQANNEQKHSFSIFNLLTTFNQDILLFKFLDDHGKFSLKTNGNWNLDLIRYNNSSLHLGLGLEFEIKKLFTVKITANSINRATHIYFPFMRKTLGITQSYNFFSELWDSLKLWDIESRKRTNFKLANIEIKAIFDLHDWDLSISYTGGPKIGAFKVTKIWDNQITFLLEWKVFSEIKTQVGYKNNKKGIFLGNAVNDR